MCFNLGYTRLTKFTNMMRAMAEGKYSLAAERGARLYMGGAGRAKIKEISLIC
jgi:hypothetical protein